MTNSRARGYTATKVMKADVVYNNSDTFTDILELPVQTSTTYFGMLTVFYDSSTVADIKIDIVPPASTTGFRTNAGITGAPPSAQVSDVLTQGAISGYNVDAECCFTTYFIFTTSTTAGTIKIQTAQNVAEVSNTTVHKGSCLILIKS